MFFIQKCTTTTKHSHVLRIEKFTPKENHLTELRENDELSC